MIPWLLVAQIVCESGKSLSALVDERIKLFPASGEINRKLPDGKAAIQRIENLYKPKALSVDYTDGLSMEFDGWRFNLRTSNTEPLVRLNVESRGDEGLMKAKTQELLKALEG
jgi:phosphomannomutase